MPQLTLYPHQEKATDALFEYLDNKTGFPLIVAPVGGGKSLLIAEFIKRANDLYPGTSCIVMSHVTELLTQDAEHLLAQWPGAPISFCAAKLGKKKLNGQIIFASVQSIYKSAHKIPHKVHVIIVDEAHLISPNAQTMYRRFIDDVTKMNPNVRVVGFTGTNFRATEGRLTEGEGRLFTDVAYQIPMLYLIEKGFLCPLVTPQVNTHMSTQGVHSRNGDYIESELQKAVDRDPITKGCVDEILLHGQDRKKWLVFTAGVDHCLHVRDEIRARGISCEMVTGKTPTQERNGIVDAYKNGELRCLVNVGCFTTGFNNPAIDLMAFMRPTRSPVLYVQMGGRGMRTSEGKENCVLLDFGGVISELGPIDLVDAQRVGGSGDGEGEAPVKTCPTCNAVCFAGVGQCPDCGYMFPLKELNLDKKASSLSVLSSAIVPVWTDVLNISYKRHAKEGKTPSMVVTYHTLDGPYREWVCYEHTGFARQKAVEWHTRRGGQYVPESVEMALQVSDSLLTPYRIKTRQEGKFTKVVGYDFTPPQAQESPSEDSIAF